MPITQQRNAPGLLPIRLPTNYGDPFAGADAVRMSSAASWIPESTYLAANRPGTPRGGLTMEMMGALSDIRLISSYDSIAKPLTIPGSIIAGSTNGDTSRANRTGSLELNMLDLGASMRMATGSFIGQETPLIGAQGSGGPMEEVLGFLTEYSRLPSRILDYAVGLPLAWLGVNKASVGFKNADGTMPQPFQQDQLYWDAIQSIDSDEGLAEMARTVAYDAVGPAMAPALAAQLYAIFQQDKLSLTGLSSGNERTDYIAKKKFETWQQPMKSMRAFKEYVEMKPGGQWAYTNNASPEEQFDFFLATLATDVGSIGPTLLPFGTGMMELLSPVSDAAEAGWLQLTPEQRRSFIGQSQLMQTVGDIAITLPMFGGIGQFLNFAKMGAAGKEFLPLVSVPKYVEGMGTFMSETGNSYINIAKQAAWAVGKPGVRVPSILTEGGTVGRLMGSRFAMPQVYHLTNLYDSALQVAKITLMDGIAMYGINWGLKMASPEYAKTYGREIDNSHWVSESDAAAAVDMMGLFTGGTMGAAGLLKLTGGVAGSALSRAGLEASVFNAPYAIRYGGSGMVNLVQRALGNPTVNMEQPFVRHITSVMQKWVQRGFIDLAEMHPDRAADIMAGASITGGEAMTQLGRILKAAQEKSWGIEGDVWTQTHRVAQKQAQTLLNDIHSLMEAETGNKFWARTLSTMKEPSGRPLAYNADGLKEAARQLANMLGKDGDAYVATVESSALFRVKRGARARLEPWQQNVNVLYQQVFDRSQGILQAIRNSGTSASARLIEIVRKDHLFSEDAIRYTSLYDDIKAAGTAADPADVALLEMLRQEIIQTPDVGKWWASMKRSKEGTRKIDDLDAEDIYNFIDQYTDHLPSRRVLPGDDAVDGELNRLHRDLDAGGIWTLAYKATEKTAAGTERAQMAQHVAEQKAWEAGKDVARQASQDARAELGVYNSALDVRLYEKYTRPGEVRLADLTYERRLIDEELRLNAISAGVKPLTKREAIHKASLERKLVVNAEAYAKAAKSTNDSYMKRDAIRAKDAELKRLMDKVDAASDAETVAINPINMPLGYRIGPVQPDGYSANLQEVFDAADVNQVGPDIEVLDHIAAPYGW
jgi:hypothetical protein